MLDMKAYMFTLWLITDLGFIFGLRQHTNVIIIGGTGDLARKYLWNGALSLFVNNQEENSTFSFYAGARVPQEEGSKTLDDILDKVICELADEKCVKLRPEFIENSQYVMVKTAQQYKELCEGFSSLSNELDIPDFIIRQIFYFSIPSSAYQSVARLIHENCRNGGITSTQVVLEKPFGLDKATSAEQVKAMSRYFKDDEVYRVDHYLAKPVTKQILNFRNANKQKLEELLNSQYVDRVEIVMKEQIGVKGRIDFYEQTGVVRDVMQNHLTELLALVAMDLPSNISDSDEIEQLKLHLLKQTRPVGRNSLITGQYLKYMDQAKEEIEDVTQSQYTPTFAAALVRIENQRWHNVPFVIMSGKHMDERSSYVRILFREKEFCVSGCADGNSTFTKYPRQLIFQIGHGPIPSAGILVSKSLFNPYWPAGLRELTMTSKDSSVHGQSPGDFYYAVPIKDEQAYVTVLHDLYHNVRETFVTANRVLLLWEIWDNVIKESHSVIPRMYKEYHAKNLNFTVGTDSVKFTQKTVSFVFDANEYSDLLSIPSTFRNGTLVCKKKEQLYQTLAESILRAAKTAILERGVFHIALSGGSTPILLFRELVNNFPLFPWEHTHIWQVDERCVSHKHEQSNFRSLHDNLIQEFHIPYFNIHPMPVNFAGKICDSSDKGDNFYEDMIKHYVAEQQLDFVLLGLGSDGHTASMFPNSDFLEAANLVSLTKTKQEGSFDRMSLLFPLINKARDITVLVTGKEKHVILHKIVNVIVPSKMFPITYVNATEGSLSWYVDLDAWTG